MKLNALTPGTPQTFRKHMTGQVIDTQSMIEGQYQIAFSRGTVPERWDVDVDMIASLDAPAIGGQALHSHQSNEILARQIEEFCSNFKDNPCYIQWFAGGSVASTQMPHDGWYLIESCTSDYANTQFGIIRMKMKVIFLYAEGSPPVHTAAMWWGGGARVTSYSGAATPWIPFPPGGSYSLGTDTTHRVGAEATIPFYVSSTTTLPNPFYFQYGPTISNWFIGGCHVYDTINTGTYPVPTTTFVNAQWVEVFSRKHTFSGDVWITNGLVGALFQNGTTVVKTYAWDTNGTPQWRQRGTVQIIDNPGNSGALLGLQFMVVGPEYLSIKALFGTSAAQIRAWINLQRGEYALDIGYQPLSANNTAEWGVAFFPVNNAKIIANESGVYDAPTQGAGTNLAVTANYGWALSFAPTDTILSIFLWQQPPGLGQPYIGSGGTNYSGFGESAQPTQNLIRWYGIALLPFANLANLQAEAETGVLGTGWSSGTTIAGYSGTGEAILASGTASGNADLFGTSYVPLAGSYDVWMRVAVSARASATVQWTMGLWDTTASAFIASTSYAPTNAVFTGSNSFIWIRVATNILPTAGHNVQFRVVSAATTDTVLYVDQAVLVPKTAAQAGNSYAFPQDIWQQDMWATTFTQNHHA